MAALAYFLSRSSACRALSPPPPRHLFSLLTRPFSSDPHPSPTPDSDAQPTANDRKAVPIQPVSYAVKPKPPVSDEIPEESSSGRQNPPIDAREFVKPDARSWTRDDMRYMKDSPSISQVAYSPRVAPLPDDNVTAEGEEGKGDGNVELERETARMRMDENRRRGGLIHVEEVDDNLPFPKLIKVDNQKKSKPVYDLKEAVRLVKGNARKTFDETFEAHVKMTSELRRTDLKLNSFVRLPHGFGKTYRVAAFAEGAAADEAREAGADIVGGPELVNSIRTGEVKIDFDKCVATPSMMEHVKKLSRNLKQLMPDAKKGTLSNDLARAVKEAKEQSVQFKKDKTAIVHVGLGKLSFSDEALRENVGAFVNALLVAKPAGLKKSSKFAGYIDTFYVCSTMGSSFRVSLQSLTMVADRVNRLQQAQ